VSKKVFMQSDAATASDGLLSEAIVVVIEV